MEKTQEEIDAEVKKQEEREAESKRIEEEKKSELVDEKGVSWKNRAKENERKLEEERRLREEAEQKLSNIPKEPEAEEDEWTKQQRDIARQEYANVSKSEKAMKNILDNMEKTRPLVKKYREVIEARLLPLSINLRSNPNTIKMITDAVIGENVDEILKENRPAEPGKERRLIGNGSEVLDPTPSGNLTTVVLSDAEISFADEKRLWDKFDDAEIREMYKKRKTKLEGKK